MEIKKEQFSVSGKIISELSEKIPSNIIALNELIKNSYDAGADKVTITLDVDSSTLTIYDDGQGFDLEGIRRLLHIAESEKKYGAIGVKKRKVQGSKGLGFLSVFKFGQKKIVWKTKKDSGYYFEIDYSTLVKAYNISDINIDIFEDNNIRKGTEIIILLDDYNKNSLMDFLSNEKLYLKTLYSFINNDMKIEINVIPTGMTLTNKSPIVINDIIKERQIYQVKYSSITKKLSFTLNTLELYSVNYPFLIDKCIIDLSLVIFNLQGKYKSKVSKLFWDNNDSLMPLIYVNDNIFYNTTLFDPNVNIKVKTSEVLNQIIGYINIISSREDISFNSDRTQFTQNLFSDQISLFLYELNKYIQTEGSKRKNYLVDKNFIDTDKFFALEELNENNVSDCIRSDFSFPNLVKVEVNDKTAKIKFGDYVTTLTSKETSTQEQIDLDDKPKIDKVKIQLSTKVISLPTKSGQVNLRDYIMNAINSEGNKIAKSDIKIYIDSVESPTGIIPSIDKEQIFSISYEYNDKNTGNATEDLIVKFTLPTSSITLSPSIIKTFSCGVFDGYKFTLPDSISDLIIQYEDVCKLSASHHYRALRAASLRVFFELGTEILILLSKDRGLYVVDDKLGHKIKKIISYCLKQVDIISASTKINKLTLANRLSTQDIFNSFTISNLGSHSSTSHLTDEKIANIQSDVSLYIVLINELINNTLLP